MAFFSSLLFSPLFPLLPTPPFFFFWAYEYPPTFRCVRRVVAGSMCPAEITKSLKTQISKAPVTQCAQAQLNISQCYFTCIHPESTTALASPGAWQRSWTFCSCGCGLCQSTELPSALLVSVPYTLLSCIEENFPNEWAVRNPKVCNSGRQVFRSFIYTLLSFIHT